MALKAEPDPVGDSLVFVIGAGASKEFGLPTGAELKADICQRLATNQDHFYGSVFADKDIKRAVDELTKKGLAGESLKDYYQAAKLLTEGLKASLSIDNFIETHSANTALVNLGKLAISSSILKAEARSSLTFDQRNIYNSLDLGPLNDTWLGRLFSLLASGRKIENFIASLSKITFISFNYDRCIHQYFFHAIQTYFGISAGDAAQIIGALRIVYPYGTVQKFAANFDKTTNYGQVWQPQSLSTMIPNIRTFTEGCIPEVTRELREIFEGARRVYFMGFGFLPLNMKMLFGDRVHQVGSVMCTGKGLSRSAIIEIKHELSNSFVRNIGSFGAPIGLEVDRLEIFDMTCAEVMWELQRDFLK